VIRNGPDAGFAVTHSVFVRVGLFSLIFQRNAPGLVSSVSLACPSVGLEPGASATPPEKSHLNRVQGLKDTIPGPGSLL
jgi:hypothetical protein